MSRVCAEAPAAGTIARVTSRLDPVHMATRDANLYKKTGKDVPISWRAAVAAALKKLGKALARQWSAEQIALYSETFAARLVDRGFARPKGEKVSGPSGATKLPRRLFSAPTEELARQDDLAAKAGKSWNAWALEHLSQKTT